MIGTVANRYNYIDKILLINPATKLDQKELSNMQARKKNKNIVLVGNKDGSYEYRNKYSEYAKVHIVMNADHHFSGESLKNFISAADMYLFRRTPFLFLRQLARLEKE